MFQDRISKFDIISPVKFSSFSTDVNETMVPWLFDCPAYSNLRLELATSWQTQVGTLFRREPLNWAALGEGPQFDEIAESRHAEETRISILQEMWRLRCAYKAQKALAQPEALTPGVEAV